MKKLIIILSCLSLVIISLSIAYYFVLFLPQQQRINTEALKKIEQSTTNTEENTQYNQNTQPNTDTTDIQSKLNDINNSLQDQRRDQEMQHDCEANNGEYQGNGVCVYKPQRQP